MVALSQSIERRADGQIDRTAWFNRLSLRYPHEKLKTLSQYFHRADERGLKIASILLDLHADLDAILAALLYSQTEPIEALPLLKSLHRLDQLAAILPSQKAAERVEKLRQMMLFMVQDIRVVLVKLAERTCAIREAKTLALTEQQSLANEVMALYAPLANRLGIGALKWELEDRAFAILNPQAYQEITHALNARRLEREAFIQNWMEILQRLLETTKVRAEVSGRVKHIYGIWMKMQQKHLAFTDLYDLRAVRILVPDVSSCYAVMALLHAHWEPVISEYTDYISHPKVNGYQSLHTVLLGEDRLPIEVQIRTFAMHEAAESGVAAHWRYKEGGRGNEALSQRINWLRLLLDWQQEVTAEQSEIEKQPDAAKQVFVFTRDQEVLMLPQGATPIDFAFLVHTDLGLQCKGAKINGQMVPLTTVLQMGDQVEILTHKMAHPSRDWLNPRAGFLVSAQARRKLRAFFRALERPQVRTTLSPDQLRHPEEQPAQTYSASGLANSRSALLDGAIDQAKALGSIKTDVAGVRVQGVSNLAFQLAKCCHPVPQEPIIGSMTRLRGIVIHRQNCSNVAYFKVKRPERLFKVEWE